MDQPYVEIHPLTALELGVVEGGQVRVETVVGSIVLAAKITLSVLRNFLSHPTLLRITIPL